MTSRSVPNLRKVKLYDLTHPCPAAGSGPRTRQPRARLDRWTILRDLLVDAWSNPEEENEAVLARHLGVLSELEANLIRKMYLNVRRAFPVPPTAGFDPESHPIHYDDSTVGITTAVSYTFSFSHDDGHNERVRLKTGRSQTTAVEAAVSWAGADPDDRFVDLMAWPGEVEEIAPPSDLESVLSDLIETAPFLHQSGVRPGPACVHCSRSAVCGAFPADRVVPSTAATVNLTKTDVEVLGQCQRRVAWRRVHGIPRDDGDEVDRVDSFSRGRLFHEMVARAETGEDREDVVQGFLGGAPPSERAGLEMMWANHCGLVESEGLDVKVSEFPVGATLLEGKRQLTRGVTLIGFVDLVARAGDPVVVELKTGAPGSSDVEDDIYAVGMSVWVDGPVVIHRHFVGMDPPVCEMVEVQPEEMESARQRLRSRVTSVHEWDWEDPLQPPFQVGGWCSGCEFKTTCESYRG